MILFFLVLTHFRLRFRRRNKKKFCDENSFIIETSLQRFIKVIFSVPIRDFVNKIYASRIIEFAYPDPPFHRMDSLHIESRLCVDYRVNEAAMSSILLHCIRCTKFNSMRCEYFHNKLDLYSTINTNQQSPPPVQLSVPTVYSQYGNVIPTLSWLMYLRTQQKT